MKNGVLLFLLLIVLSGFASALGISPAKTDLHFVSGGEHEIIYNVRSDSDREVEIYIDGDLSEYAKLSKTEIVGSGSFTVKIKFPEYVDIPGEHRIMVGVKEKPTEDYFLGTAININGYIKVLVPYPGRYAETVLKVSDGNVDSEIPVEVQVINRGKEDIDVDVNVQFFTEFGEFVYNMPFSPATLVPTKDRYFRKFLNTIDFKPGNYFAESIVSYGDVVRSNKTFRVGSLFVNVTNFTEKFIQGGIQKFNVDIESKWNANLQEVFADVNISNSTYSVEFRTPSSDLDAWERKTLTGFLDTSELLGKYDTKIVLHYLEEESQALGGLVVLRDGLGRAYILWGVIAIVLIIGIVIIVWIKLRKNTFRGRKK
jgi:hypothetical protein